jgi:hypothetical protein
MLTDAEREAAEELLVKLRALFQPRPQKDPVYLPQREGMRRYGIRSRTEWWKIRRLPGFPPPLKTGPKSEYIHVAETDVFMENWRKGDAA